MMPIKMEVYLSTTNSDFKLAGLLEKLLIHLMIKFIRMIGKIKLSPIKTRYIKVKIYNYGTFPKGHLAEPFDGISYIFLDEITVK